MPLISQSKVSGLRKFSFRYQQFQITEVEMQRKRIYGQTIFFDIREYFEISVFEIWRVDCIYIYKLLSQLKSVFKFVQDL